MTLVLALWRLLLRPSSKCGQRIEPARLGPNVLVSLLLSSWMSIAFSKDSLEAMLVVLLLLALPVSLLLRLLLAMFCLPPGCHPMFSDERLPQLPTPLCTLSASSFVGEWD